MRNPPPAFFQLANTQTTGVDSSYQNPPVPIKGYAPGTANFFSAAMMVGDMPLWGVQIAYTGGAAQVGTLKLQASCDPAAGMSQDNPDANIANWYDLICINPSTGALYAAATVATAAGAAVVAFKPSPPGCESRWIRLAYVYTSGAAISTITATIQAKSFG